MEVFFGEPPLGSPRECRAFLPHDPGRFDLSPLRQFALTVTPILSGVRAVYPDEADTWECTMPLAMRTILVKEKFNPAKDYVVLLGDPIISAVSMATLGQMVDSFVLLRYDGQAKTYWPFRVQAPKP